MELFALYFNILLVYVDFSIRFWITWTLKKENPKLESFPPSADLGLDNIYPVVSIYISLYIYTVCVYVISLKG